MTAALTDSVLTLLSISKLLMTVHMHLTIGKKSAQKQASITKQKPVTTFISTVKYSIPAVRAEAMIRMQSILTLLITEQVTQF